MRNKTPINSINLQNYSYEPCHTYSLAGSHLSCKPRSDLCICNSTNLKKAKVVVGCIYLRPHTDLNNDCYFNNLLNNLPKKKLFSF